MVLCGSESRSRTEAQMGSSGRGAGGVGGRGAAHSLTLMQCKWN